MKYSRMHRGKQRRINITRLMARDGMNCAICGESMDRSVRERNHPLGISFDHIVPRSAGGLTVPENLRLAHRECNRLRGCDPVVEDEG